MEQNGRKRILFWNKSQTTGMFSPIRGRGRTLVPTIMPPHMKDRVSDQRAWRSVLAASVLPFGICRSVGHVGVDEAIRHRPQPGWRPRHVVTPWRR